MDKSNILKKILLQGLIVILLIGVIMFFRRLPGWLIQAEMKKQLSMIQAVSDARHDEPKHAESENVSPGLRPVSHAKRITPEEIYTVLKFVKDPEIDINVVDLGLIQSITNHENKITVTMIFTRRFCPYQAELVSGVKEAVKKAAPDLTVNVIADYSKTWRFSDLTENGKKQWERFFGNKGDN